ncbi:hypothetical protein BGZ68_007607 [Mortierella alpina]|nr:hypothetical protein BGZ68_007607 [Mortierella alpina]
MDGLHFEQYDALSSDFIIWNGYVGNKLVKLYRVTYNCETRRMQTGSWSQYYYHCTGNCACLARMADTTLTERACSQTWCGSLGCPIQSILNYGLSMSFEKHGGHYFSNVFNIAKKYGLHKDPAREILAVLICKARDIRIRSDNSHICYVTEDECTRMEPAYMCDGLHYEQYDSLSPVFQKYNVHFSYNLNILKIGLSICFAHHGGHYFSDVFNISKTYGLHKDPKREFLAVLICRARDIQTRPGNHNIKFVERSEHILPYYLALVRV